MKLTANLRAADDNLYGYALEISGIRCGAATKMPDAFAPGTASGG